MGFDLLRKKQTNITAHLEKNNNINFTKELHSCY